MMRETLGSFRAHWPADTMGICVVDPQVAAYCNESQQRLLIDPMAPDEGWFGGWVTMNFTATVVNGYTYVVTPREIARLIVTAVCQHPMRIRNGFYEYLKFGQGLFPKTRCNGQCQQEMEAIERDNVVTFSQLLATPQIIRVYYTDIKDTGLRVLIQGNDANGLQVLTADPNTTLTAPGEYVQLGFPYVDTLNQFTSITGIQKDETYGVIQIFQVDPSTGTEVPLSTMQPEESVASYRRYLVHGIKPQSVCCNGSNTFQLQAQAKLDFIPVVNETDYLIIPNIPALIEECMSIRYGRMETQNAANQSAIHHAKALQLLNGQLDHFHGKVQTAVSVPIFGSNRMRPSFR